MTCPNFLLNIKTLRTKICLDQKSFFLDSYRYNTYLDIRFLRNLYSRKPRLKWRLTLVLAELVRVDILLDKIELITVEMYCLNALLLLL